MLKNVKIDEAAHRALSIKASQLGIGKSDLATILLMEALRKTSDKQIEHMRVSVTSHDKPKG